MDRILGPAGRVVAVRVPAGDREHPLRHQLTQAVIHLAGWSSLLQTGGELVQQSLVAIGSFQQQSATLGTTFSLIKLGNDRLAANIRQQQTLCCAIVKHEEASRRAPNSD